VVRHLPRLLILSGMGSLCALNLCRECSTHVEALASHYIPRLTPSPLGSNSFRFHTMSTSISSHTTYLVSTRFRSPQFDLLVPLCPRGRFPMTVSKCPEHPGSLQAVICRSVSRPWSAMSASAQISASTQQ
jgi:hypothetical protein